MEFQDVIRGRKMVRSFEKSASGGLPPGALERMLDNARRAPSAGFSQGWAFLTFEGEEQMESFWRAAGSEDGFRTMGWPDAYNAAAAIVPLAHARAYTERYSAPDKAAFGMQKAEAWPTPYWLVDTSFAAMAILLTVVDEGLGALFFGLRDIPAFRAATGVPDEYHPIGVIIIGHPAPDRPSPSLQRGRRPKEDVVHRGHW